MVTLSDVKMQLFQNGLASCKLRLEIEMPPLVIHCLTGDADGFDRHIFAVADDRSKWLRNNTQKGAVSRKRQ
jgi:hypothetical protein